MSHHHHHHHSERSHRHEDEPRYEERDPYPDGPERSPFLWYSEDGPPPPPPPDPRQAYQSGIPPPGFQGFPPQGPLGFPPQYFPPQFQGPPPQQYQTPPPNFQRPPPPDQGHPFIGGPPPQAFHPYHQVPRQLRRKSLLIGINYVGSKHALRGCQQDVSNMMEFLSFKGYSNDRGSQVVMRDDRHTDPRGPFFPTGRNILAAMQWLVSEPNTCNFLHYSGHGGQVPNRDRQSGADDTIVPVDFESHGQIPSGVLHRILVSSLPPNSTLFVIFDCCHSGSAIELPYVYRSDEDGNISMMDNLQASMTFLENAGNLLQGGFSLENLAHGKDVFEEATVLWKRFNGGGEKVEEGVYEEHFVQDWKAEHKFVTMFSGCRDDQTSADANIGGASVGAMSWAFLETMKRNPNPMYLDTLQQTRAILGQSRYSQVPQLSIGFRELDLSQPLRF